MNNELLIDVESVGRSNTLAVTAKSFIWAIGRMVYL